MIELRADVKLKDTIVMAMPKHVVFGHVLNGFPKKIVSDVAKNLNNPRQATRVVPVAPNVSFKSTRQIYKPVSNKNGVNTSDKKKEATVSKQEVNNSNPFDALNSIENDDDLVTNGGISMLAGKGSLNVAHGSSSNTPIVDKIDKLARQILDDKLMFVDDDENSLVSTGNVDSESELEVTFDETKNLIALTNFKGGSDRCYGTNSLLEQ
nr:hypothetical protein [Tanacetum cinerariifolium]